MQLVCDIITMKKMHHTPHAHFVGPIAAVDCVHLLYPEVHGAVGLVAAGCRDSTIYLWRRRAQRRDRLDDARSMRENVTYRLDGHNVRLIISGALSPLTLPGMGVVFDL